MSNPFLSIVIPAHNEETRLPDTLEQVLSFLNTQLYPAEVLVVENGSQDRTLEVARSYCQRFSNLHVLQLEQCGKGRAVQHGMLQASGEFLFMCDADLSMPISQINQFIPPVLTDFDIAIASREAPGAVRYNEPAYRHLVGRVFNTLIHALALPGMQDTQCGFKCFRAPVARELFPHQTISGWSFDVEVLFIARQRGYRIVELPIPWHFNAESKVRVFRDSARMALDLLAIRANALRGIYNRDA
ncbi:MAG: glycosyl transferase [Chloroflexi bacterium RBG_16_58_14]|nr:MAG: glycosyl transferase [Chloroflexi bacterium RBG_16_58_14]